LPTLEGTQDPASPDHAHTVEDRKTWR